MKKNGLVKSFNLKPLIRSSFDVRTFCGGGVALEMDADLSWIILDSGKRKKQSRQISGWILLVAIKTICVENEPNWKLVVEPHLRFQIFHAF